MRKRSSYRPRVQLPDPLAWVLGGLKPITTSHESITLVRIKNHSAIQSIRSGTATINDVDVLIAAFNIAEALAQIGQGADWLPEIRAAQDALASAGNRSKYLFSGAELTAVNLGMEIHDAQLDHPQTTIAMMDEALRIVTKVIRAKKARPIKFEMIGAV